jgi:predicted N-acetyltransferase YhbS
MKNAIAIRPALARDASTISRLLRQLGYDRTQAALAERIAAGSNTQLAFVAQNEGNVIGFMSLHIIDWLHRSDPAARLSAVVVDTNYRRLGIGRALIAFAEARALERGCTSIELTSNLRRKADGTYDFYASLGYQAARETTYFRKPLTKQAS